MARAKICQFWIVGMSVFGLAATVGGMGLFEPEPVNQSELDISDLAIKQRVKENLLNNAIIPASKINVFVEEGVVSLKGKVKTYLEKEEATLTADATLGVIRVDNEINVAEDLYGASS